MRIIERSARPIIFIATLFSLAPFARSEPAKPDGNLAAHSNTVLDLAFSPDGARLATVGDDGTLKLWDIAQKKEISSTTGLHANQNQVRFTPDGKTVVALGDSNNIVVFDVESGKAKMPIALPSDASSVAALDLSPDGKTIAVVGRAWLKTFDLASGKPAGSFEVHAGYQVSGVAFSPDGKTLATVGSDHVANIVDVSSGKILKSMKLRLNGMAVTFSRDGKTLFAAVSDKTLQSFDVASGEAKTLIEKSVPILSIATSVDGKMLVIGGPGHGPWLVALPGGEITTDAFDCDGWIKSAAISPDGKWVAGGSQDGNVYLWKVPAK